MYSPYEFIYWYDKLNEEDKKIILFYLSSFPEDTDIEGITMAVKKQRQFIAKPNGRYLTLLDDDK